MSPNDSYLFNAGQIEKVYFRGYEDKDEIEYNKQLRIDFRNEIRDTETSNSDKTNKDSKYETENTYKENTECIERITELQEGIHNFF